MKELYDQIKIYALELVGVNHVCLWNDQLNNLEEEVPFMRPAVFVEFGVIQWTEIGKRQKKGILPLTIHLVTDCYDTLADDNDALKALEFLSEASDHFDGKAFPNCTVLSPDTSAPDNNHGNLIHQQLSYTTEITSCIKDKRTYTEVTPGLKVTGGYQPRPNTSITPP